MTKWKFIIILVAALGAAVYVAATSLSLQNKSKKITELKAEVAELQARCKKLEDTPVINQQITFALTNKAVFGKITAGDFAACADQVQTVTRKALADYCDSVKYNY